MALKRGADGTISVKAGGNGCIGGFLVFFGCMLGLGSLIAGLVIAASGGNNTALFGSIAAASIAVLFIVTGAQLFSGANATDITINPSHRRVDFSNSGTVFRSVQFSDISVVRLTREIIQSNKSRQTLYRIYCALRDGSSLWFAETTDEARGAEYACMIAQALEKGIESDAGIALDCPGSDTLTATEESLHTEAEPSPLITETFDGMEYRLRMRSGAGPARLITAICLLGFLAGINGVAISTAFSMDTVFPRIASIMFFSGFDLLALFLFLFYSRRVVLLVSKDHLRIQFRLILGPVVKTVSIPRSAIRAVRLNRVPPQGVFHLTLSLSPDITKETAQLGRAFTLLSGAPAVPAHEASLLLREGLATRGGREVQALAQLERRLQEIMSIRES